MPDDVVQQQFQGSMFQFSGAPLPTLTSSEYTLVGLAVDASISIQPFMDAEISALRTAIQTCQKSPRADNLLIRTTKFDHPSRSPREFHGFKELIHCKGQDYDHIFKDGLGSATALYDACVDAIDAVASYGAKLFDEDYTCNGVVFIITDGCDNSSKYGVSNIADAIKRAVGERKLESLKTILIGINVTDRTVADYLDRLKDGANLDEYIEVGQFDAKTGARLAEFVSKSISATSQALGTGGPSTSLSF